MDPEREKIVSELDDYIATCRDRLTNIFSTLGWNEEDTLQDPTSFSSGHRRRTQAGRGKNDEEPPLPESFDCKHSIVIDENKMKEILKTENVCIPERFSDIQLNFTREQKRELYDYVILNTGRISEPELKVIVPNEYQGGADMTFAEIVAKAKKKDKKLKRKYRTSKPTHIEEVRNLVHLQMQALEQYFNPTREKTRSSEEINRPEHSRSRRDRSQSKNRLSSKHRHHKSRSSHKKKHSRSHKRSHSSKPKHKRKHSRRDGWELE